MTLTVLDGGLLTTVQDRGRFGHAHLGVPRAGALDAPAAELANRLVGNPRDAAVLEATLTGVTVRADRAVTLAVTGARCEVRVAGRAAPWGEPVSAHPGAEIIVGPALRGVRSYLAISGGIDVEPVLGSRSTDTLAWVGPPVVRDGTRLPLGPPATERTGVDTPRRPERESVLRLHPGPRADWFTDDALTVLTGTSYAVTADSNRIGLRLTGPALARLRSGELPSEGMVLGAVQVPPDGQPVVFLNDHPVTGGYPVVAVVDPHDLPVCAQTRPGERLSFVLA